jgi:hypothetical protein
MASAGDDETARAATLEALWAHLLSHWDDDKAHLAFLEHCQQNDLLLPAAKRYRSLAGHERYGQEVERRLRGITALAMARMEHARTTPAGAKRQAGRLVAMIFVIAIATGLLIFYTLR